MSDQDLIAKLNLLAEISTEGTGYAPDEHIAGIAADRIAELEARINAVLAEIEGWGKGDYLSVQWLKEVLSGDLVPKQEGEQEKPE